MNVIKEVAKCVPHFSFAISWSLSNEFSPVCEIISTKLHAKEY
jgi:hypothetical protein